MERRALVAFFVFLFVGLPGYSQPCLSIDRSSFDFGEVMDGAVVEHTFLLKNVGDRTLKIFRVAYNCSCTSYKIPKTEIAPGESVPLTVRFTTTGYSALPQPISQTVTIYSNDPANPHKIALQGRVLATQSAATIQSTADTPLLSGSDVPASRIPLKPTLVNLQVDLVTPEDAEAVLPILDLIESYGWRTTVYVTGKIALAYPDLVKEIHDRGHQIGVLGWEAGEDLLSLSEDELYDRLENAFLAVRAAVGEMRPEYIADFKPQGYLVSETLLRALSRLGVRSCSGKFPDGPNHPHHLEQFSVVAIPLAESVSATTCIQSGEAGQILATDIYSQCGQTLAQFFADLQSRYDFNRQFYQPIAAAMRPSSIVFEPGALDCLRNFVENVVETSGFLVVVDQLTSQANPFIEWLRITAPATAMAGEEITITVYYYANCYCPRYYFMIYGCEHGPLCDLPLVRAFFWEPLWGESRFPYIGEDQFTFKITLPLKASPYTYRLVAVGQACHGGPCWPTYSETIPARYDAMNSTDIKVTPLRELLYGTGNPALYNLIFIPARFSTTDLWTSFREAALANWDRIRREEPFKDYVDVFNVWAIYWANDSRLNCSRTVRVDDSLYWTCDVAAARIISSLVPNAAWGTVVVLVNTTDHTGLWDGEACRGRGTIIKNRVGDVIMVHEFGHGLGLGDEYVTNDQRHWNKPACFNCCSECSQEPDPCSNTCERWADIPGACCYEGCKYVPTNWYRSANNCIMNAGRNDDVFCPVCQYYLRHQLQSLSYSLVSATKQEDAVSLSRIYALNLKYSYTSNLFSIEYIDVIEGYPDPDDPSGTFHYEVTGALGDRLYSARFRNPLLTDVFPIPPEEYRLYGTPFSVEPLAEVHFALLIPYFWNAHVIRIYNETGDVILEVDVSGFSAGAIRGIVRDFTGNPCIGASVYVRGPEFASTRTDDHGAYEVSVAPGNYSVYVMPQDPNLMGAFASTEVTLGRVTSLDFVLGRAGSIAGTVTDAAGAPISGVWVRPGPIWQEPPHYQVVNGDYIIPSLSAGTYTVEIDAPGYGEWYIYVNGQYVTKGTSVTVEVELGKTTRVDFTQRSPGVGLIYDFEYTSQTEAEAAGWTFTGLWKLITEEQARRFSPRPTPFPSPTHAAYFGNENGNYVTLGTLGTEAPPDRPELRLMQAGSRRSYGELTSPAIPVSGVSSVELSFQYFRVVEYYPKGSYDKTYVQVSLDGGSWETIWSLDSTTPSEPGWKSAGPITISVPTGASTMRVRFAFDSVDHFYNNYLGWLVDNVLIVSAQPGVTRFTYSNLTVAPTAGPIPLRITAVATLTNIGTTRGTENVRFFVDGVERATRAVTLDPGSSTTITFDYTFTDPGNYSVTIDNLPPVTVRAGMALFYEGFEAGALGWEFTNLWHISSDSGCFQCEKLSGAYAYYAQGCNYNTRARTKGTLTSPVIDLQGAQFVQIRFDHFRHVEQYAGGDFDRTTLEISFDGGPWTTVWMRSSRHPSPECGTVTIGPFAVPSGATAMRLRFVFDSVDQYYNDFRGWAVDNVTVAPASSGQPLATFAIEPSGPRSLAELISVFNVPNPVRDVHTTTFVVRGVEAEKIRAEVYDLAGRLVWQGEGLGNELSWGTQDLTGLPLANGVYLWRVWVKVGEEWVVSAIQKLVILR